MLMDGLIVDPMDQQLCEFAGSILQHYYPHHEWLVEADRKKGMLDIRNLDLHGGKGYRIKMNGYATSSELQKIVMLAGGELLERADLARGAMTEVGMQAIEQAAKDKRGNVIMDEG
jgi:hypothetical protein